MHGAGLITESNCTWCAAGKYQTGVGVTAEVSCSWCAAGKYQTGTGGSRQSIATKRNTQDLSHHTPKTLIYTYINIYNVSRKSSSQAWHSISCMGQVWSQRSTAHGVALENIKLDLVWQLKSTAHGAVLESTRQGQVLYIFIPVLLKITVLFSSPDELTGLQPSKSHKLFWHHKRSTAYLETLLKVLTNQFVLFHKKKKKELSPISHWSRASVQSYVCHCDVLATALRRLVLKRVLLM